MPLFEYHCKKCNASFEELVFSNEAPVNCPTCESADVEKMLSTFGVSSNDSNPCGSGMCGLPDTPPTCGEGACPACMN